MYKTVEKSGKPECYISVPSELDNSVFLKLNATHFAASLPAISHCHA